MTKNPAHSTGRLPADYPQLLTEVKARILVSPSKKDKRRAQARVAGGANSVSVNHHEMVGGVLQDCQGHGACPQISA